MKYKVGIVGATGAVGQELIKLLEKRKFPVKNLHLFASQKSVGKKTIFSGQSIEIETIKDFKGFDFIFLCAGRSVSQKYAEKITQEGALAIDSSSFFRYHPDVPLVIPEINPEAIKNHKGLISSPNCTTTIMLLPLFPLHKLFKIRRIVSTSYQAASGAGALGMTELLQETHSVLNGQPYERSVFQHPYAFNLFTHNSPLDSSGYVEEELKMIHETRKILNDDSIKISPTCVRVPVLRAHSLSMNVSFEKDVSLQEIYRILEQAPGIKILNDYNQHVFPMPVLASEKEEVLCGRIREDFTEKNTFNFWVAGDQLLKGAALNAIQIAELVTKRS
ncbi:MAG: aspartate-semialdehyde dehydrogenase [Rhabdochlamydiaceae bacterium]